MGKQVTFQADKRLLEEVNAFARNRNLKFFRIEPSRTGQWQSEEEAQLDVERLCQAASHQSYYLVPLDAKLPTGKENLIEFILDKPSHIELALFMDNPQYNSRIWFETGGHTFEKDGNALLRKIRAAIKKINLRQEPLAVAK